LARGDKTISALYQQLGSTEGQINAEIALGGYYATHKDKRADQMLAHALKLAKSLDRKELEASVFAQMGKVDASIGALGNAVTNYKRSAELYHSVGYSADEAYQLQATAAALNDLGQRENAMEILVQGVSVADTSSAWAPKYWLRRDLAIAYERQGHYELAISVLGEGKRIADSFYQPLNSAWASLEIAADLAKRHRKRLNLSAGSRRVE
jgi:tetratricopeptide (TPR) repeat protein